MDWQRPEIKVPEDILAMFSRGSVSAAVSSPATPESLPVTPAKSAPPSPEPETGVLPTSSVTTPPINSPWNICPAPTPPYDTPQWLYRLEIEKNRTWKIMLIDSFTADRRVYCSGKGAALTLDGMTYNGAEFATFRGGRSSGQNQSGDSRA